MNEYRKLYRQLLKLKQSLLDKNVLLDNEIKNYELCKIKIEKNNKETIEKKEAKAEVANILTNYKKILLDELKEIAKFSGLLFAVFAIGINVLLPLLDKFSVDFVQVLYGTITAFFSTLAFGGALYLRSTHEVRTIHKEYKEKDHEIIEEIKSLDMQISNNKSDKVYCEEMLENIKAQQVQNKSDIIYTDSLLLKLNEKIPHIEEKCMNDKATINAVYEDDLEIEPAIKLIREKN